MHPLLVIQALFPAVLAQTATLFAVIPTEAPIVNDLNSMTYSAIGVGNNGGETTFAGEVYISQILQGTGGLNDGNDGLVYETIPLGATITQRRTSL
uniref:Uncharacterized protein n=1 Tax=Moniliophthora roreri TaxID=221103 RepID=A0A0W0G839_MONRR